MLTIDHDAPAITRQEAVVDASPEEVLATLADVERWPSWQPAVSEVTLDGPMRDGASFRWKAGGSRITSKVALLQDDAIGWHGRAFGIRAVHTWHVTPVDGGARVVTEESMAGPLARVLPWVVRRLLRRGVADALEALATEAPRRASAGASR